MKSQDQSLPMKKRSTTENCERLRLSRCLTFIVVLLAAPLLLSAQAPGAPTASQATPAQTTPQPRTIQLDDFLKITSVSDPQISPDGRSIAFVVSHPNLDQDRSDRDLLLIDIASGVPRALTHELVVTPAGERWVP